MTNIFTRHVNSMLPAKPYSWLFLSLACLLIQCSSNPPAPVPPNESGTGESSVWTDPNSGAASESSASSADADPKPPAAQGILEEVSAAEAFGKAGSETGALSANPAYEQLRKQLEALGYEGVGLEHESAEVLSLLTSVFQHPDAANRKIKRVYTGGAMEYDAKAQAVTIGGLKNQTKVLNYFKKNIPRR